MRRSKPLPLLPTRNFAHNLSVADHADRTARDDHDDCPHCEDRAAPSDANFGLCPKSVNPSNEPISPIGRSECDSPYGLNKSTDTNFGIIDVGPSGPTLEIMVALSDEIINGGPNVPGLVIAAL
ncbi:hypothetical protein D8674_040939 [Pyrus ussuriensis x Pyrus communis]|uniref:Uncharacterized protein n=1 Tax=Pyrus ussuriensis x Pyrus communis TaxID=2448454 RepID=A0A5N5FBY2_9ROSA|nr:hypothetical protein D8674_040939 [Pyrus ussuriensis x Pyrus communis]